MLALELYGSLYDRQSIAQTVRDFERILDERLTPLIQAGQAMRSSNVGFKSKDLIAWDAALRAATEERSK